MAELNLKQIADKLKAEFTGDVRKLVFWYDDNAEFAEDIDTLELENAKVLHLAPDNQFYTKYFLECVDRTTLASMILSLESVFAVLFGWLILHQALSARELLGCLVIFIAIVIAQLPSKDTSAA